MPKSIQLRNVPDELHKELKARASLAGMSLAAYLISLLERIVEQPTVEELRTRLAGRKPVRPGFEIAEAVREARGD